MAKVYYPYAQTGYPKEVAKAVETLEQKFGEVVFTGSRAMGYWHAHSDWDFVVKAKPQDIMEFPVPIEPMADDYSMTCQYYQFGQELVNVIFTDRALHEWQLATDICRALTVQTRKERLRVFRLVRDGFSYDETMAMEMLS